MRDNTRRNFLKQSGSLTTGLFLGPALPTHHVGANDKNKGERTTACDIFIVGGSLGGVAAALSAARLGRRVLLTEETNWIGGQATTQGVPLDEHPWIEKFGRTESYASFRSGIRKYYRRHYSLSPAARNDSNLNPGAGWVSALGFEPRVGIAVLHEMLMPYMTSGLIEILYNYVPVQIEMQGDKCTGVVLNHTVHDKRLFVQSAYVLDATEQGDLLPLAKMEFNIGAESQSETNEPSALSGSPEPNLLQPITHLIAVDYRPGETHVIEKPAEYDKWKSKFQSLRGVGEPGYDDLKSRQRVLFAPETPGKYSQSIWNFRRVFCKNNFAQGAFASDITMLMSGNEYSYGNLLGVSTAEAAKHRESARQLSLSLLYFFQTDVPDGYKGGAGFPGLRARGDVFGTEDGLAQYPYIRESRRIKADFTIKEQDFSIGMHPDGPVKYKDSVGVGGYRIDIHLRSKDQKASMTGSLHGKHWPQQLALGALIPQRVTNILPACKNLGVTHVTNGAFRLHPVEWNIGEAAGALAAFCLNNNKVPKQVRETESVLKDFRQQLGKMGVETEWASMESARSYNSHYVNVPGWYWGEADLK